jgi:hypothetical protein
MSTPANKKWALECLNCWKILSEHLGRCFCLNQHVNIDHEENTLSILVPPSEVRLHPQSSDQYRWQYNSNCKHLFLKNLSDLSTNNYVEIYRALQNVDIWAAEYYPTVNKVACEHAQELEKLREECEKLKSEHVCLQKRNR